MMKKMLLLAGMALAAVAFAAPAAQAHAPEWFSEGVKLAGGEKEELHVVGELASQAQGSPLVSGPCEVTFEGTAENVNGMAGGKIVGGAIESPCATNLPGCSFSPTLNVSAEKPWSITGATVTGEPGIEIVGASFTNHYTKFCQETYKVPAIVGAGGTATGILSSDECISLEGHQDDLAIPTTPPTPVNILGEACVTAPLTIK